MPRRKAVKPDKVKPEAPKTVVVEGFWSDDSPRSIAESTRLHSQPSFVGFPTFFKYRVTVEQLEEPAEVLAARLQDLWETTERNHHHTDTFRRYARRLGIELPNETRAIRAKRSRDP